jgi:transposase
MTMPPDDAMTEAAPMRRLEVFTGAGHRRTWSAQAKRQIVADSYSGLETACAVARRYGRAPTQLFTWRRELRAMAPPPSEPLFAPVVVETPVREPAPPRRKARRARHDGIELEIDGVTVRVGGGAQAKTVAAVIRALKARR